MASLISDAERVGDRLHVKHTPGTTVLLRTLGINLPPAVTAHYKWSGNDTPFDIQRKTAELLTENPRAYVLSSFGTGKTKAALWSFDYLRSIRAVRRMLIVAPLSTLRFVWGREVFETTPHLKVNILHGDRDTRLRLLTDLADVYVINPDGLGMIIDLVMKRNDIDVICIDELAMYRNNTKRTKLLRRMARNKPVVWGMTGAPTPNAPTDVYNQAQIITPHTCSMSFIRFRDTMMVKVNDYKWVPRKGAIEKAMDVLRPHVRFTLDDVVELPDFVSRYHEVEMSPMQKLAYEEIRKHCYSAIRSKEITVANAAVALVKLLQISMGWVYSSDMSILDLQPAARLEALVDLIDAADHKVLVFVPYKHAMAGVMQALQANGIEAALVSGDTPAKARAEIFNLFQNTVKYKALVAHHAVLAHGLTLTSANTVIWYGPITSLELYDQSNARIRRVGQMHHQLFIHMFSTPVEKRVYNLLINKIDAQDQLLQLLEQATSA